MQTYRLHKTGISSSSLSPHRVRRQQAGSLTRTSSLDGPGKSDRIAASIRLASSISFLVRFRRRPEGHSHVSFAFKHASC